MSWEFKFLIKFTFTLIIVNLIGYYTHDWWFNNYRNEFINPEISLAYIVNAIEALVVFTFIYIVRNKMRSNIGFIFLGSSLIKFLIFFIVFQPIYEIDGEISKLEFGAFFIPYSLSLITETAFLIKLLNKI